MKLQVSILAFGITLAAGVTFLQLSATPSTSAQGASTVLTSTTSGGSFVASGASFKTSAKPELSGSTGDDD